jgi:hypothetical protein
MIPPYDFCAPAQMTVDLTSIEACIKMDQESNCVKGCNWYKGSGDFTEPTEPTPEVGHCEIAPVTSTTPAGTADVCYPIMVKAGCLPTIGCNWNPTPKAPVKPAPEVPVKPAPIA